MKEKKDNDVWECKCGYSSFKIQRNGDIICWECDTKQAFPDNEFTSALPNAKFSGRSVAKLRWNVELGMITRLMRFVPQHILRLAHLIAFPHYGLLIFNPTSFM